MAAGKSEKIVKRLQMGGVSTEDCHKYVDSLRAFMSARITKPQFEQRMNTILSPDKIRLHNSIIHDLLFRALQKRDGAPDLPLLPPLKDKRPANHRRPPSLKHPVLKSEPVKTSPTPPISAKRPLDLPPPSPRVPDSPLEPLTPVKRPKPRPVPIKPNGLSHSINSTKGKPVSVEKPVAPKRRKPLPLDRHPNLPPPSPGPSASNQSLPPPELPPVVTPHIETYQSLPFMPVSQGSAMDIELFARIKDRISPMVKQEGLSVRDDAVALVAQAAEIHIKRLLEAAVLMRRRRRVAFVPRPRVSFMPVRLTDLHQSASSNAALFADDPALNLERLSMLL